MKNILFVVFTLFFISCGNKKVLLLPEINHSEISEIKDHFDFFDRDGSGLIDLDEFCQLLKILAPEASQDNAVRGFATIDVDNNEQIDFAEFLDWWKMNWTVF